jgi:hypothetical protein
VTQEETAPASEVDVEAINIAAAKLCGWTFYGQTACTPGGSKYAMVHPRTGEDQHPHPDYWNDARHLSDLWAPVEAFGGHPVEYNRSVFGYWLSRLVLGVELMAPETLDKSALKTAFFAFAIATAPPRFHVEAALRTCGQWPVKAIGE